MHLFNICRSVSAQYIFDRLIEEAHLSNDLSCESAATSTEEIGNPIYPPAAAVLRKHGIDYDSQRTARQMKSTDYQDFNLIIAMDEANVRGVRRIAGGDPDGKIHLLLDYAGEHRNVADPWYTRDFETAYDDIMKGCRALLDALSRS